MTAQCKEYRTTVKNLQNEEKEKEKVLAKRVADIEEE
jgi:hypothetical protein